MTIYLMGLLLLAAVLFFVVIARPNKARFWWRILASTAVIIGMGLLVIPIKSINHSTGRSALLILTEGYQKDTVQAYNKDNAQTVSVAELRQVQLDQAAAIHLFGYGLPDTGLLDFDKSKIGFHPSSLPTGIATIHWNQALVLGQALFIQGIVNNLEKKPLQIVLCSGYQVLEQISIPASAKVPFQFIQTPKNLGTGQYQLLLLNGKDTLSKNPVPFIVDATSPVSVLMLHDAPGFEQKFLKNWLTDHGYSLAARTRISKQLFDQAFSNRASTNLNNLNANLLSQFQILLTDEASLNSLSAQEQYQIRNAIQEKGLGLLVTTDTVLKHGSILGNRFSLKANLDSTSAGRLLKMNGLDTAWHPQLFKNSHLILEPDQQEQLLVMDANNRGLAAVQLEGLGKIGFSVLEQTHLWSLAGKQIDYGKYWSQLLESVLKTTISKQTFKVGTGMDFVGTTTDIQSFQANTENGLAILSGTTIHLLQDKELPFKQMGQFWPNKAGWQILVSPTGQIQSTYIFGQEDWKLQQWTKRIKQTEQWLQNPSRKQSLISADKLMAEKQLMAPIWAWLLLILGLALLWVESKLE
ncbi:MAG: hypothetical protein B7Y15_09270 [Bacteroidetes bacterium 24-39-8]|nr:MAG: hypothetical protein B7Y69_04865 [Sphingobacteriia bacterium 35-40-8]OYZ50242.1 MAG: hypothetical protein B7Y15_09270 [Bacteroidetes bacterium 24-39-8]OZA67858.1 MAG: hypothetical protein B7X72_02900 [Sphingobacteriia bacterium 39-39-8]